MAVTIRLQRHGRKNTPFFHMVVADSRKPNCGRFLEKVGYYDPNQTPSVVVFKEDRVKHWYSKGATLSSAVNNMMKKHKVELQREKTGKLKGKRES